MPRFDAITGTIATAPEPAPRRKKSPAPKAAKAPPVPIVKLPAPAKPETPKGPSGLRETSVSRHACRIPVATFAALLGTDDMRTARDTQTAFVAWCAARPELTDWRAAWTAYRAGLSPDELRASARRAESDGRSERGAVLRRMADERENAARVPQTEHVGDPILPGMKGIQRIGRAGYLRPANGEYDAYTVEHRHLGHAVTFPEAVALVENAARVPQTPVPGYTSPGARLVQRACAAVRERNPDAIVPPAPASWAAGVLASL